MKTTARIPSWVIPVCLFVGFIFHKWNLLKEALRLGKTGPDGGYYLNIALHVRDGHGFVTSVSPFNQGVPTFPHYSSVYPLWPVFLGALGHFVDVFKLAYIVPASFHVLSVFLAFRLGKQLFPEAEFKIQKTGVSLHWGYFLAFLFAANPVFNRFTLMPYTEGLAWCLMLGLFLRSKAILARPSLRGALELGFWFGLLLLVRSQFLVVMVAFVGSMVLAAVADFVRKPISGITISRRIIFTLGAFGITALCLFPHLRVISTFAQDGAFWSYLRFDQMQVSRVLPRLKPMVETAGLLEWIRDRLQGVVISFSPASKHSFSKSFFDLIWGLPIFLLLGTVTAIAEMKKRGFKSVLDRWALLIQSHPELNFLVMSACGLWLSLYTIHFKYWTIWPFSARHGFAAVFAFFFAWPALFSLFRIGRKRLLLTVIFSCLLGLAIFRSFGPVKKPSPLDPNWPRLGKELSQALPPGARVILPGEGAKKVGPWAMGLGLHQVFFDAGPGELGCFQERLGVTHLVIFKEPQKSTVTLEALGLSLTELTGAGRIQPLSDGVLIALPSPQVHCDSVNKGNE